jgi:DNA-binding protein H-NS
MARLPALSAMGVEELLKLREEVMAMLSRRATALQAELAALEGYQRSDGPPSSRPRTSRPSGPRTSSLFGRKIPPKYRDQSGNTWSGRGAQPRWLTAAIKAGAKREDFLIDNSGRPDKRAASATRLGSSKKSAKRAKSARRTRPAKRAKSATRPKSAKRPTSAQRSKSVSRAKSAKVSNKRLASRTTLRTKSRPPSPRPSPMSNARQKGAGSQAGEAGRADQP